MGGLIGGGKSVKAPMPKKVAPLPTVETEADDEALRKGRGAGGGFQGTIITGALVPKSKGKKLILSGAGG